MISSERQARIEAEAAAALAKDKASRLYAETLQLKAASYSTEAMIAHLKLQITSLIDDGRVCLTNNAAERSLSLRYRNSHKHYITRTLYGSGRTCPVKLGTASAVEPGSLRCVPRVLSKSLTIDHRKAACMNKTPACGDFGYAQFAPHQKLVPKSLKPITRQRCERADTTIALERVLYRPKRDTKMVGDVAHPDRLTAICEHIILSSYDLI